MDGVQAVGLICKKSQRVHVLAREHMRCVYVRGICMAVCRFAHVQARVGHPVASTVTFHLIALG